MHDIQALHPALTRERRLEWELMRAAMDGEETVKSSGEVFLPMPGGFKASGDPDAYYRAYKARAMFPEILAPSVAAMIGIVHAKDIEIQMPAALEYLWEDADSNGLPLEAFHRRITRELLVIGSYAILADAPEDGAGEPWLAGYARDSLTNWDTNLFVVDETGMVRKGLIWEQLDRYRLFALVNGRYQQVVYEGENLQPREVDVRGMGGQVLPRVPFAVGNARDLSPRIESPPLIGVANAARAIYQLSADYRWQLHMSGQETMVAINGTAPSAIGAGVVHEMQGPEGTTPDLKYVTPACTGIEAHRAAMEEQRMSAIQAGARMIDSSRAQESGEARRMRFASEMANLQSVAINSCALLERALRNVAMLKGLDERAQEEIVVTPPVDLLDNTMTPQEAKTLMEVWIGGGISYDTYYANLKKGGIASSERTAEDEAALVENEPVRDMPVTGQSVTF